MTLNRRNFLKNTSAAIVGMAVSNNVFTNNQISKNLGQPIVISTWEHGLPANEVAWHVLTSGGHALNAVEKGVMVPEGDPNIITVGYGGIPDAKGKVTLDACIMDEKGRAGSVAFLQHIKHPISVARLVMEKTPHVMLSGKGALQFALENGFKKEKLLTPERKAEWKKWKKENKQLKPVFNIENQSDNHDTIGMIALDSEGRLCGACTTSGMSYKFHGRVGDSPIIGAGLFVDGEVGGAAATGSGELAMKTLGSFLVVELMRQGKTPFQACREAVIRITKKIPDYRQHQLGYIALNVKGEYGAFCIQPGFNYAVKSKDFTGMINSDTFLKYR